MTIVQLNATAGIGSTGKIMYDLNDVIINNGWNSYMVSGYLSTIDIPNLYCMSKAPYNLSIRRNILISRLTGKMGYRYKHKTEKAIEWIDSKHPDLIHLHNIHGDWINIKMLFDYIKTKSMPVVWTLHDCWPFTGRCSHFEFSGCQKWRSGCSDCSARKIYPITYFFDYSAKMYEDKRDWFTGIKNMTIVTPSEWLAAYVKQSFLKDYPVKVIRNGINTEVYCPQKKISRYYTGLEEKYIILGVASSWSAQKGYDDFIKLDAMLNHEKYQVVMVGLNAGQMKQIPTTILGISRTNNERELAELYSGADVFVNPTYQDNYPTTNLEAQSCGTPVVTYHTGGSPEGVLPGCGAVIKQGDLQELFKQVQQICKDNLKERLCDISKFSFDRKLCFGEYCDLYTQRYNH